MYGELSGHASTWGNGPDFSMTPDGQAAPAEEDSSLAFLAWMQSSGAGRASGRTRCSIVVHLTCPNLSITTALV